MEADVCDVPRVLSMSLVTNLGISMSRLVLDTWLRALASVVVMTSVITYWALPLVGQVLSPWLNATPPGIIRVRF